MGAITVAAEPWQFYGGGVFTGCSSGIFSSSGATLDHGVQLVGYTADYWIVRPLPKDSDSGRRMRHPLRYIVSYRCCCSRDGGRCVNLVGCLTKAHLLQSQ